MLQKLVKYMNEFPARLKKIGIPFQFFVQNAAKSGRLKFWAGTEKKFHSGAKKNMSNGLRAAANSGQVASLQIYIFQRPPRETVKNRYLIG